MTIHFRYGGSTAKRTLRCPGWAALAQKLAEERGTVDNSSVHADRGSMLHKCCELLEKDGLDYDDLLDMGVEYNGFKLTEELLDTKVIPAMEALDDLLDKYKVHTVVTEETIKINDVIGGTLDVFGEGVNTLVFADYKFGEGILVDAEDNDQLLFSGWTKITKGKFSKPLKEYKKVALAIIQPADRREEELDVWEVTVQDLEEFGERFKAAVSIAEDSKPGENLCMGDHCMFCPASGLNDCPAKADEANFNLRQLQKLDDGYIDGDDFEVLDKKCSDLPALKLNIEQALDIVEKLEAWTKDVRAFACKQLELEGDSIPGWKLVDKRATKHWVDEASAERYLKRKLKAKNAMKSVVITPAQALQVAKKLKIKVKLDDHIVSLSSGTTLARESDKRQAVLSSADTVNGLKLLDSLDDE